MTHDPDPYDDPHQTVEHHREMADRARKAAAEMAAAGLEPDPDDLEPDALTSDHPGRTGP